LGVDHIHTARGWVSCRAVSGRYSSPGGAPMG
jgi:hypothetical protein